MPTIRELLSRGQSEIRFSDTARLDAELLLCSVMNTERASIYSRPELEIPCQEVDAYHSLVTKRAKGWPIAYLTGHKEFWSLDLQVNEDTLIPRPETECLVACALEKIPAGEAVRIIDPGTGTGAIAIAIARERPQCRMLATDISDGALAIAASNAKRHGLENICFIRSDWFSAIDYQDFDFIVCNPPYIRCNDKHLQQGDVRFEPVHALSAGDDGLHHIRQIIAQAPDYLTDNGWLLLEHGYDQGQDVRNLLACSGYSDTSTCRDFAGNERITSAQYHA